MATTIMISTRVKPDRLRPVLIFILLFAFLVCGVNPAAGDLLLLHIRSTYCLMPPHIKNKQGQCHFGGFSKARNHGTTKLQELRKRKTQKQTKKPGTVGPGLENWPKPYGKA